MRSYRSVRTFRASPLPVLALLAVLTGGSPAASQTIVNTKYGTGAGSGFGVVAPAGDVNHDGIADLIVGAPFDDEAGPDSGLVRVLSGNGGTVLLVLHGAAAGERFGTAVASAGDLDGDGTADVLVGAPGSGSGVGHARVHSGATGAVLLALNGSQPGDRFGASVAAAGDLDGDGTGDLLVGAPGTAAPGSAGTPIPEAGAVLAVSGDTGFTLHVFQGEHAGDHLGASVGGKPAGTLLVDGEPGIIIGCTQDGQGASGGGLLRVHSAAGWGLRFQLSGAAASDRFGFAVTAVGDLDADGVCDVLAGSCGGYARLLSGASGDVLTSFAGPAATLFGAGVGGVGDVNGDGVPDLAIGEPGADGNGVDAGAVHVYSGASKGELHVVHGPQAYASAGSSIAGAGDVNGDLLADVAVGAPGTGGGGTAPGGVFTLSLTRWIDEGGGLPGIGDIPRLEGQGGLVANTKVELLLTGAHALSSVTLVLGNGVAIDPVKGSLTPLPTVVTTGLLTDVVGGLHYSFTWPTGMPTGSTVYYQFRIVDPLAPGGVSMSNTLAAVVP